jgi:signal transduction histidine kinase
MQECLNNIQIHSGASQVGISMMADQDSLYLEIGDDGKGFDMKKVSGTSGTGLYNMRERVHILKGEIKIISSPGKGTKIRVRIPYHIEK